MARVLGIEYAKVLELLPGGEELLVIAGVGWEEGSWARTKVDSTRNAQAGYTPSSRMSRWSSMTCAPRRAQGASSAARARGSERHDGHQGLEAAVRRPGAHTRERRTFTGDDVNFLKAVAT